MLFRYKIPGLIVFLSLSIIAEGQNIGALRFSDKNKSIAADTNEWRIHRLIKDIDFSKNRDNLSISFGGEIRQQLRVYQNLSFGDIKPGLRDHDIFLWQRYFLHTDIRLNKNLRIFGQLNSNHVNFKDNISPEVDHDDLGVIQAFADLQINVPFTVLVRIGRQELSFGAERMIGTRDGPNIRQSFDGARITAGFKNATGDFLIAQPVSYQQGVFDNFRNKSVLLYSTYWTIPVNKSNNLDLYYIGQKISSLKFAGDTATENRHSLGVRLSNSFSRFYYDAELIYQFGKFGNNSIRAWQLSSIFGYRWNELALKPRIQVREGVISGDKLAGDGIVNAFRPVSARPPVSDLMPAGPSNIVIVTPEVEVTLYKGVTFIARYMGIWRLRSSDGMYAVDVKSLVRPADDDQNVLGKVIANGIVIELNYLINQHFSAGFNGGHFFAGNYIRNTGKGESNNACAFRVSYKF